MQPVKPKTIEEHTQSVHDMARLQLWFVWTWLRDHPQEQIVDVLRQRVDLLRKTDIYPGKWRNDSTPRNFHDPRWLAIEDAIAHIYQQTRNHADAQEFEEASFTMIRPAIDARIPRDLTDGMAMNHYQCGSLKCDPPKPDHPRRVSFHIANALEPVSCFTDPLYLPRCLQALMHYGREHYAAEELATTTWLNQLPRWLELFPQSWIDHMGPPYESVDGGLGHWGQFLNSRGLFNHKLGLQMRQTGRMPYLPCSSWCCFDDLQSHLQTKYGI